MRPPLFRWTIVLLLLGLILPAFQPTAQANSRQKTEEELEYTDARLEGFPQTVYIEGGTSTTWFLLVFLGLVGLSVLFKDAKRTHLD
ncbi:MAG: hypothetical protein IT447_12535 [Phycisphaerales bacterium]|jgi:hypothetical protein|nr:hypothetical protein [Phycisphaerales bacterium]